MTDYSLSSVKTQISDASEKPPEGFKEQKNQSSAEKLELDARGQFIRLRGHWSVLLIIWITSLLVFQISLALMVGTEVLNFENYQWFLPLVVAQNFGQVVGMGLVIVRFLYPPKSS